MKSQALLIFLILLVGCLGQFASDIYTPSLPAIATYFHVHVHLSQLSMVSFMLGVVFGMIFYGPVSEGIGRRKPLLVGLVIALIGSVMCVFATSIEMLIIGRAVQGVGAAAGMTLWRTIFRDTFSGTDLAKYGSYLGIFVVFIIPLAPIVGGYFQHYLSWRASFIFLAGYAAVALICIFTLLKETATHAHPERLKLKFILGAYKELLTSRIFLGSCICVFLCYGALFSWFTVGPVLLIHYVKLTPVQFGWMSFVIGSITAAVAGFINGKLVARLGVATMLRFAFCLIIVAGVALLCGKFIFGVTFWSIAIPVFLACFGVSFVWPNMFANAFQPFGHISGYAGSLYSLLQLGGGAVLGALAAHLPAATQIPQAIIFLAVGVLALLIYEKVVLD